MFVLSHVCVLLYLECNASNEKFRDSKASIYESFLISFFFEFVFSVN